MLVRHAPSGRRGRGRLPPPHARDPDQPGDRGMNRTAYAFFGLAALVFVAGMLTLANREVSSGEAYPQYSSLRTDPDGTKLLYDGLSRLPGVSIGRNFMSLDSAQERHAVFFLIGVVPERFDSGEDYLVSLRALAEDGNRILVTFHY